MSGKMIAEEEYLRVKTELGEKERSETFTYEIHHGFQSHGNRMSPEIRIILRGGDTKKIHALAIDLEQRVLEAAKEAQ